MLLTHIKKKHNYYITNDLLRKCYEIQNGHENHIIVNKKSMINFSSNDYLGLARHPEIKKALVKGVELYGLGSGSSVMISGYFKSHRMLEEQFAEFLKRDRAMLFNSGYHANLAGKKSIVKEITTLTYVIGYFVAKKI